MKIAECRFLLNTALNATRVASPPKTILGRTGETEREMILAYLSDGTTFFVSDDPVNALASFYYAFGWLHCGNAHGTLVTEMGTAPCPFISPSERLPQNHGEKLSEKAGRYERLLNTARSSVACAPEPSTYPYELAEGVLRIAETYEIRGRWLLRVSRTEDALAAFSYGHGWLDAAVRAGLFTITGERDIFTV